MRGFETGLFLRTKGGSVEEYGCEVKQEHSIDDKNYKIVKDGIENARAFLTLDRRVEEGLDVVEGFMEGVIRFYTILSPDHANHLD